MDAFVRSEDDDPNTVLNRLASAVCSLVLVLWTYGASPRRPTPPPLSSGHLDAVARLLRDGDGGAVHGLQHQAPPEATELFVHMMPSIAAFLYLDDASAADPPTHRTTFIANNFSVATFYAIHALGARVCRGQLDCEWIAEVQRDATRLLRHPPPLMDADEVAVGVYHRTAAATWALTHEPYVCADSLGDVPTATVDLVLEACRSVNRDCDAAFAHGIPDIRDYVLALVRVRALQPPEW